jgi:hypothetical protein
MGDISQAMVEGFFAAVRTRDRDTHEAASAAHAH